MTCIVGVKTEKGVLLGGDSLGSDDSTGTAYTAPKVFQLSQHVAAGYTTSFRMGQVIEHHVAVPMLAGDERVWAITEFVPALREAFKEHGYAHVQNNEETGGYFLLAVRARLFLVQANYSVMESLSAYDAVGAGEYHAMGAMHALYKPTINPRRLLRAGLDAACAFSRACAPPYDFVSTRA